MNNYKETTSQREERIKEEEGGRRFRSKTWSANGDKKDLRKNRKYTKNILRKYL